MAGTLINRTWHANLNTFLSLACEHVEIRRYGQERLLIVLGTSQYFHCLILGCRHVEIGGYGQKRLLIVVGTSEYFLSLACRHAGLRRDCQKRLLIVLGTSQYFLIRILESCLNWKAWSKTIMNRTWYISIHSYR